MSIIIDHPKILFYKYLLGNMDLVFYFRFKSYVVETSLSRAITVLPIHIIEEYMWKASVLTARHAGYIIFLTDYFYTVYIHIYIFIQFTAIKSNQKQHNDKRQYS